MKTLILICFCILQSHRTSNNFLKHFADLPSSIQISEGSFDYYAVEDYPRFTKYEIECLIGLDSVFHCDLSKYHRERNGYPDYVPVGKIKISSSKWIMLYYHSMQLQEFYYVELLAAVYDAHKNDILSVIPIAMTNVQTYKIPECKIFITHDMLCVEENNKKTTWKLDNIK